MDLLETAPLPTTDDQPEYTELSLPPKTTMYESAVALSAAAALSTEAERLHETSVMHTPLKEIANSMGHPGAGYLGALAAYAMLRSDFLRRRPLLQALAGGTVADVVVERSQDLVVHNLTNTDWFLAPAHQLESLKDYAFALGGALIFYGQRRFSAHRKAVRVPSAVANTTDQSA